MPGAQRLGRRRYIGFSRLMLARGQFTTEPAPPLPQWHASSEKARIPGLHRPPGHSKSRSSKHMQSTCREEHWKSSIIRDASAASSERPLPFPLAGHTQAMWRHRATPLQPEAPRKYWSTNTILCDTINESRVQCQYMMRIRQVSLFEGLRGRRLVLTTNCAKGAQEERRRALQSICRAWTWRCSRACRNRRNAQLLDGLMDRDGTFNGNWKVPGPSPD